MDEAKEKYNCRMLMSHPLTQEDAQIIIDYVKELESQNKELVEGLGHILFNDYFDSYEKAKEIYDKYKVSQ